MGSHAASDPHVGTRRRIGGGLIFCDSVGSGIGEIARELAYRLYQTCERKKLAEEARSYNALVVSWPEIVKLSRERRVPETARALPGMEDFE